MCMQNLKSVALPVPEIIGSTRKKLTVPEYAHTSFFPKIFNWLMFRWTLWIYQPNLKSVAFPVPEIIGSTRKIGQSLDTPTLPFSHGLLFVWTLLLFWPNLKFVALPVPEIIAIGVFGGVWTPNLGEGAAVGRGWYHSKERRWVPMGSP